MKKSLLLLICLVGVLAPSFSQKATDYQAQIEQLSNQVEQTVIRLRREFHQYPELSNREFKTAERVAAHLKSLGIEVQTDIAFTGVVGILKGGKPGPVVGLRADMDGLPVVERVDLPFASKETSEYNGQKVGVMHACGHDSHMAILLGVAEVLSKMKNDLKGTVKFVFQPAEEGAPRGEEGGAALMIKQGVLDNPKVDAMFGLHIWAGAEVGQIQFRSGGLMASADKFRIKVKGVQAHGSAPWQGIDPIVVSAQIIMGLQTIVSRQMELTEDAAVITVGSLHSGVRNNIIPEEAEMEGTIRALNSDMQEKIHEKIRLTATKIAESAGATAEVEITKQYPVTFNDPDFTKRSVPSLQKVAGVPNVVQVRAVTGAEDFSFFQQRVPGFFFFLGGRPKNVKPEDMPSHHTPDFYLDESGFVLGVKALTTLTVDFMESEAAKNKVIKK